MEAASKDITLGIGESVLFQDKNITLAATSADSFILCINNEKYLLNDDKTIDSVLYDVKTSNLEKVRIELRADGSREKCEDCSNEQCYLNYVVECNANSDCVDEDICTQDRCFNGKCQFTEIEGCKEILEQQNVSSQNSEPVVQPPVVEKTEEEPVVSEPASSDVLKSFALVLLVLVVVLGIVFLLFRRRR